MRPHSIRNIFTIFLFCAATVSLQAAELKKVLILEIHNIENKADYQYLESSITEAVKKSLSAKFAYKDTQPRVWKRIAEKNYLFKQDFHTLSVGLNLGLLAHQDVVICGGYRIIKTNILSTRIQIVDIANKKSIADFTEEVQIDNRIFDSIEKISEKIASRARAILPSKEDWKRSGAASSQPSEPLFAHPSVGIRIGAGLYQSGYADRLVAAQPTLQLNLRWQMPLVSDKLSFGPTLTYFKHDWKRDFNNVTKKASVSTQNLMTGVTLGFDIWVSSSMAFQPKIGAGYVWQKSEIGTDNGTSTGKNSFPYYGAGAEFMYSLNDNFDFAFEVFSAIEQENSTFTFYHTLNFGTNLKF